MSHMRQGIGTWEIGDLGWANPLQGREALEAMNHFGSPPSHRDGAVNHGLAFVFRPERWPGQAPRPFNPVLTGLSKFAFPSLAPSDGERAGVRGTLKPIVHRRAGILACNMRTMPVKDRTLIAFGRNVARSCVQFSASSIRRKNQRVMLRLLRGWWRKRYGSKSRLHITRRVPCQGRPETALTESTLFTGSPSDPQLVHELAREMQSAGRGLRHAPEKDCLTVLDFVGQAHRRYRIDRKLKALLSKRRFNIQREVEMDFPHLPPGCSIQLDRVAREHVLANIRANLRNLADQVPDRLESFEHESGQPLTFGNFVRFHDYEPEALLSRNTWTQWKAGACLAETPTDKDIDGPGASFEAGIHVHLGSRVFPSNFLCPRRYNAEGIPKGSPTSNRTRQFPGAWTFSSPRINGPPLASSGSRRMARARLFPRVT